MRSKNGGSQTVLPRFVTLGRRIRNVTRIIDQDGYGQKSGCAQQAFGQWSMVPDRGNSLCDDRFFER